MRIPTSRFAELLQRAREWDGRFPALHEAQLSYLIENFTFADDQCTLAARWDRYAWDVAYVAMVDGKPKLFTRCI